MADHRGSGFSRYDSRRSEQRDRGDISADPIGGSRDNTGFYRDRENRDKDRNMALRNGHGGSLSSLIVRASDSSRQDYEPGEISEDRRHSSYADRRDRYSDAGYDMKGVKGQVPLGSDSPLRHRIPEPYGHDYDRNRPYRGRGFRGGRGRGRFRDYPPPPFTPAGLGRGMPPYGRGVVEPGYSPEPFAAEGESFRRNNPNVSPREGDWICSEPTCGNLNFARRTHCNNCDKPRRDMVPFGDPHGGFRGPLPCPPFMNGAPMGRGMGRGRNGFGPPRGAWARASPREFDHGSPPRPGERSPDFYPGRDMRDRTDYHDRYDYRERDKFTRLPPADEGLVMGHRDSKREDRFQDRRGDHDVKRDRRLPSPAPRSQWERVSRERSRSPIRNARDYHRDSHFDRLRDGRRDRRNDAY